MESEFENLSLPENPQSKRSLLPFLGDAPNWLTGTATTKNTQEIKQCINQLIQEQIKQQKTPVHVISFSSITRYAVYVYRQTLNEIIDAIQRSNEDLNRLFKITEVWKQSIRYQQMYIYMHTILAYLRHSLTYMRKVPIHMMDYVDAATTNILSLTYFPWKT